MILLTDRDAVLRALIDCDLDPTLRILLAPRLRRLQAPAGEDIKVVVVEGGDTPEVINQALGFDITGADAEEPSFEWIVDHGLWFEIAYARKDQSATFVFVENGPATELGIHHLCLSHFWPDGEGGR